jgi:hypothetical protein
MLTATVTAISMIDAITGLRAFILLNSSPHESYEWAKYIIFAIYNRLARAAQTPSISSEPSFSLSP